jgi:hypothetical protein
VDNGSGMCKAGFAGDSTGSVVTSKTGFAHAGTIVHNKSLEFFTVRHFVTLKKTIQ